MIEQYGKEIDQMHASPELIQRTKAAMRQEEKRIRKKRKMWALVPVAAVLLLAVIPPILWQNEEPTEIEAPIRAGREEPTSSLIPREDSQTAGMLKQVSVKPEEFSAVEPMETEQAEVWVLTGAEGGFRAYVETKECAYLYEDQADNLEEFLQKIKETLEKEINSDTGKE